LKKITLIFTALLIVTCAIEPLHGQSIQQELQRRGLSFQEALELAKQAGVNTNNPTELANFARQNGVPEAQIQEYLSQFTGEQIGNTVTEGGVVDITGTVVTSDQLEETPFDEDQIDNRQEVDSTGGLPYFGYDIFSDIPDSFLPSAVGPVDEGYVIGPDDELRLTIWGATEVQYELAVDAEGRTFIPTIGLTTVAGESLKNLRESLKRTLSRSYSGLVKDPATVFMDITVTRFKPIEIFVLGEVKNPGGYTFTSNSSLFNVLYGVGGPKTTGSLRDIRLIRDGKHIGSYDFYELLVQGTESEQPTLLNNDRIFIPLRNSTITIQGPVTREGIYELLPGESINELFDYAGGLQPEVYSDRFQINRIIPIEERDDPTYARQRLDFDLGNLMSGDGNIELVDNDRIRLFRISDVSDQYVQITGGVNQPGIYELDENLNSISDLISAADGLQGDFLDGSAILTRYNDDSTSFTFNFNVLAALNNDSEEDLMLQRRDRIQIFQNNVIEIENRKVFISGQIEKPGGYSYTDGMTLEMLLLKSGGFTNSSFLGNVEITRTELIESTVEKAVTITIPLLPDSLDPNTFYTSELFEGLMENAKQFVLNDNDRVFIRPNPKFESQETVKITGEITYPGSYTIVYENELLSQLIRRAGWITPEAYSKGARLKRDGKDVIIELDKILSNDITTDVLIKPGDEIFIPSNPNTVLVTGNVALDGLFKYKSGEKFTYYLDQAGGMQPNTFKYLLLTQANGATYRIKRKGLVKDNPIVEDGAVIRAIYEPEKPDTEKLTFREILGESTAILTSVLTWYLLIDRL
jgi:protein involved in polysaccharide export with SLBB domain